MLTRVTPADIRRNKFSGLQMGHLFVSYDREVAIFVKDTENDVVVGRQSVALAASLLGALEREKEMVVLSRTDFLFLTEKDDAGREIIRVQGVDGEVFANGFQGSVYYVDSIADLFIEPFRGMQYALLVHRPGSSMGTQLIVELQNDTRRRTAAALSANRHKIDDVPGLDKLDTLVKQQVAGMTWGEDHLTKLVTMEETHYEMIQEVTLFTQADGTILTRYTPMGPKAPQRMLFTNAATSFIRKF